MRHRALPFTAGDWHCLPVRVLAPHRAAWRSDKGTSFRPRCMGSFTAFARPRRRVDDANDALAPRIEMDVLHLYRLAVAPAVSVKRLDQVGLQPEQLDRKATIDVDEVLGHLTMALPQETQTRKAGGDDLHRHQGFHLGSGLD